MSLFVKAKAVQVGGFLLVAAAAAASFAGAPGCADNETMLFIRSIVPPTKGCGYDGIIDNNAPAITWGILDWSCKKEYSANIVVANQLQKNASNEIRRTEAGRVLIDTVQVSAVLPGGATVAYDLPATAIVEPSDGTTPGYAVVSVPLLPLGKLDFARIPGAGLVKQVNFEIRVSGKTLGGSAVTSAPFLFPVRIGEGILVARGDAGTPGTCIGQDTAYTEPGGCPNP